MRALPASLAGIGGAVLLTVTLLVAPASAQPTTVAGLGARYHDLSAEAELINEELLVVQEQLIVHQQAAAAATKAANEAKVAADTLRDRADAAQVLDQVADLFGELDVANLTEHLPGGPRYSDAALETAENAETKAVAAEKQAQDLEAKVAAGAADVQARRATLDRQIAQVRTALDSLTPEQRSLLEGTEDFDSGDVVVPEGDTGAVLQFALGQLGKPYLWGAVGPKSYDCSGLVQTAFRAAGVAMPRVSRQQAQVGQRVDRAHVRAGDLIFYYEPVRHVAIALDATRAVHAPSLGDNVKISRIDSIGRVTVIRRVIG